MRSTLDRNTLRVQRSGWMNKDQPTNGELVVNEIKTTTGGGDVLRILLAILLPPVGVFLQVGIGMQFWINLLLTFLGYVPGIVHAVWIILKK